MTYNFKLALKWLTATSLRGQKRTPEPSMRVKVRIHFIKTLNGIQWEAAHPLTLNYTDPIA